MIMEATDVINLTLLQQCPTMVKNLTDYDLSINELKYWTYGILFPTMCVLGIIGNVLNLVVLNQGNMKGTAYVYMKGYSSAALMAILVAIPFTFRNLVPYGQWKNYYQAFFHTYLELYIGNSCLGIGVWMLVALTMERFVAVCHPEQSRVLQGSTRAYFIIYSIPICTLIVYSPHLFRADIMECLNEGAVAYKKIENYVYLSSLIYKIYTWIIAILYRLGPTILLAYLNLRIIIAYKRTCANRRRMTGKVSRDDKRKFAEENRIMLLLGSTSVLFFVCVTPMVILSVMYTESLLKSLSFQVFRASANVLEVTNYSLTFYIYCLFSREFRNTFINLFHHKTKLVKGGNPSALPNPRRESTPIRTTAAPGGSTPLL